MDLKTRLFDDMKAAMRDKDVLKKELLQIVRGGILQVEKDSQTVLDEAGVLDVIAKEHKKRSETLQDLGAVTGDFVDKTKREMEMLEAYLPEQMTEADIEDLVRIKIEETGAQGSRDMGKVMKALQSETKGRADGKLVNQIVKRLLG